MTVALFESVARIARHEAGARATAGIGKVVDLFPADGALKDHAVSVEMIATGLVLPKCPVAVGCMGYAAIPRWMTWCWWYSWMVIRTPE